MKKSSAAFAVIFALGAVYAALSSWISVAAVAIAGGVVPDVIFKTFFVGVNCAFALTLGILAGLNPVFRCWWLLIGPLVLIGAYEFITNTTPPLIYLGALLMLGSSIVGAELTYLIRIGRKKV